MRNLWIVAGLVLGGCSSSSEPDAPPAPGAQLAIGQELDSWALPPPAARVKVDLVQGDGTRTMLADAPAPPAQTVAKLAPFPRIPLPEQHFADPLTASFEATALDDTGTPVMRGWTVPFRFTSLVAVDIPIFMSRLGTWSRPPDPLIHGHMRPVVGVALHDYVIAAGGDPLMGEDASIPDIYDYGSLFTLADPTSGSQPPLPRVPKSIALLGIRLLAVDDGGATWIDLSTNKTNNVNPPDGFAFSEVAGGETFIPGKALYIIGGTRTSGAPTAKVLRIDDAAALRVVTLSTPRLGAAAAIVGSKLVVVGGTDTGPMVEVFNDDENNPAFVATTFPPDPTQSLGVIATAADATMALAVGGKDPTSGMAAGIRMFDTACAMTCAATDVAPLPMPLARTKAFALAPNQYMVTGESDDGQNHAWIVDTSAMPPTMTEKALREPRKGATAIWLPTSQVGFIGGQVIATGVSATTIEAFFP